MERRDEDGIWREGMGMGYGEEEWGWDMGIRHKEMRWERGMGT